MRTESIVLELELKLNPHGPSMGRAAPRGLHAWKVGHQAGAVGVTQISAVEESAGTDGYSTTCTSTHAADGDTTDTTDPIARLQAIRRRMTKVVRRQRRRVRRTSMDNDDSR